jgi:hypothetical protein
MLTDYLPLLPVQARIHGAPPFAPKTMTDAFKKGVQLRNKTAHAGEGVRSDTLKEILTAVHDLLYLLDVYAGQEWAWEQITLETQQFDPGGNRENVEEVRESARPGTLPRQKIHFESGTNVASCATTHAPARA